MAGATSKNNPNARKKEGKTCSTCGYANPTSATQCGGQVHTRLLCPKDSGRGWRTVMEHTPCGKKV